MGAHCPTRPRGAGGPGSGSDPRGGSLQPQRGARFSVAAAGGAERPGPELPRSRAAGGARRGHRPLRPQAPPLPPPPPSRPPARPPAQSAALGPAEPGRLSGRRRLSATLASRGAGRPGTSATPGTPLCPARPPPPIAAGTLGRAPPGPRLSSSRGGRSGESRAAAPGASEPRPLPPRLGAGGGGGGGGGKCASFPGGERCTSGQRLRLPVAEKRRRRRRRARGSRGSLAMERRSGHRDAGSSAPSLWTAV